MRRCVVAKVVVLVALAAIAAGCSGDDSSSEATQPSTTTVPVATTTSTLPPPIESKLAPGDRYVALGSSIASGFGIPVQSTACGRSDRDYAVLVARQFKLALTDVSCGAALVRNVVGTPQGSVPPQIDAVTKGTKLITVAVGGNDIGYNGKALACGEPATICTPSPTLAADLENTRAALGQMIAALHAAAPAAVIVFVTYPREVPDGTCAALGYTEAEAAVVRDMGAQLEQAFVDAVAQSPGVVFVDPYVAHGDHTGCAPEAERWTAGHVAPDGFPYHPTALGHEVMARMIAAALEN
jgi:lysophospholipase L1-like esterase